MPLKLEDKLLSMQQDINSLKNLVTAQEKKLNSMTSGAEQKGRAQRIVINGETYYITADGSARLLNILSQDGSAAFHLDTDGTGFLTTGFSSNVSDDSVVTLAPNNNVGVIIVYARGTSYKQWTGIFVYRITGTHFCQTIITAANFDNLTTTDLTGTTGTNGHLSISCNDGLIHIENRSGVLISLGTVCLGQ